MSCSNLCVVQILPGRNQNALFIWVAHILAWCRFGPAEIRTLILYGLQQFWCGTNLARQHMGCSNFCVWYKFCLAEIKTLFLYELHTCWCGTNFAQQKLERSFYMSCTHLGVVQIWPGRNQNALFIWAAAILVWYKFGPAEIRTLFLYGVHTFQSGAALARQK